MQLTRVALIPPLLALTILALTSCLLSCSDGDGQPASVFDGSTDLKLSYQSLGGGNPAEDQAFLGINGYQYLFIDGQRTFWSFGDDGSSTSVWNDVKTGSLSESDLDEMLSDIGYYHWSDASWSGHAADAGVVRIRSPFGQISLSACMNGPEEPCAIGPKVHRWIGVLGQRGEPVTGPVDVVAREEVDPPNSVFLEHVLDWPAGVDITPYLTTKYVQLQGEGARASGDVATQLRALRRSFVTGNAAMGAIPVHAGDRYYSVWVRDVIKLADGTGAVDVGALMR